LKKYVLDNEENCYFVGDGIQDVECGRRLGIKSVLVDRRGSNGDTGADYVIPDLSGLVQVLSLEQD
ncbi:MAG: HAD hydrolase-like protein, partial [Dehalococcoidales bacterium]|nr:HAD hydrolase-like protein [Dehalococcoidales bacterium]